jgi:uncharacterized membrane protein HdeD (DUF308 family)
VLVGPAVFAGPASAVAAIILFGLYAIMLSDFRERRRSGVWLLFLLQAHYASAAAGLFYNAARWPPDAESTVFMTFLLMFWFIPVHIVGVMIAFGPKAT